ncbi:LuxR family transcriptional regulator [Cereibacter sphaeroides]|uniref:helix-turn-helix transcriptional regulator n=1 Tax=Cereibacter sphaeroides TaxID=1063 RepID=UPI001F196D5F|nr:LuxR family transcriptional regulator [Cereibacter sphaeroides]MCE6957539.1 LuxR family transcriptional regulator [Cereibacter sphaeroides]MCE6971088.1 LuxR family transcriptional regulator [Cereibacter sphaeroides]
MADKEALLLPACPNPAAPVQFFATIAPAGAYVALRIGFFAPEEEHNLFPTAWIETYTAAGYALRDPLMHWAIRTEGTIRWSAICLVDTVGVLAAYRSHALRFGCVVSLSARSSPVRKRSFGLFARSDREFTDEEIRQLWQRVAQLHGIGVDPLPKTQAEVLRMLTEGIRYKAMADRLGISEAAVKARLKSACARLGARTPIQAANLAVSRGLM